MTINPIPTPPFPDEHRAEDALDSRLLAVAEARQNANSWRQGARFRPLFILATILLLAFFIGTFFWFRSSAIDKERVAIDKERARIADVLARHKLEFLNTYHRNAAAKQDAGEWHEAGDLLAGLSNIDRQLIRPANTGTLVETYNIRFANQWLHSPEAQSARSDNDEFRTLNTGKEGRLQLRSEGSKLYVVDSFTGAVTANASLTERRSPGERKVHFLSENARHAVIVATSGEVFHWSISQASIRPLPLKLDEETTVLSIVLEEGSLQRFALLMGRQDRPFNDNESPRRLRIAVVTPDRIEVAPTEIDRLLDVTEQQAVRLISLDGPNILIESGFVQSNAMTGPGFPEWTGRRTRSLASLALPAGNAKRLVLHGDYRGHLGPSAGLLPIFVEMGAERCRKGGSDVAPERPDTSSEPDRSLCLLFLETSTGNPKKGAIVVPVRTTMPAALSVAVEGDEPNFVRLFFKLSNGWVKWETDVQKAQSNGSRPRSTPVERLFGNPPQDQSRISTLLSVESIREADDPGSKVDLDLAQAELDAANARIIFVQNGRYFSADRHTLTIDQPTNGSCELQEGITDVFWSSALRAAPLSFLVLDNQKRLWRFDIKSVDANRTSIVPTCIEMNVRPKSLLAFHPGTGRALLQTPADELTVVKLDLKANTSSVERNNLVSTRQSSRPSFASFVGPDKLVLLSTEGDLKVFQEAAGSWKPAVFPRAFSQGMVEFSANSERIAISMDGSLDGSERKKTATIFEIAAAPRAIRAGALLPYGQHLLRFSGTGDAETIETVDDDQVFIYRLPRVPSSDTLGDLVEMRSVAPTRGLDNDLLKLAHSLLQDAQRSAPSNHPVSCDFAVRLFLESWEHLERPSDEGDTVRRLAREACGATADATNEEDLATVIIQAEADSTRPSESGRVISLEDERWPVTWSKLLAAPEPAKALGLRALALALRSSSRQITRDAGQELLDHMEDNELFVSRDRLLRISRGDPVSSRLLQTHQDTEPRAHLLRALYLERSTKDLDSLRRALFHFLIAERAYQRFGVGADLELANRSGFGADLELASRRRLSLAAALPDSHVRQAMLEADAWRPSSTSQPHPLSAGTNDHIGRLRTDLRRVEQWLAYVSRSEGLPLLRSMILRPIAELQERVDPASGIETYRKLATLTLSDKARLQKSYMREPTNALVERLVKTDPALAFQIRLEQVRSQEEVDLGRRADVELYHQSLQQVLDETAWNAIDTASSSDFRNPDTFRFGPRPFRANSTINPSLVSSPLFARTFNARLQLIEKLLSYAPDRRDLIVQRGITLFWAGLSSISARASTAKENAIRQLEGAIKDLLVAQLGDVEYLEALYLMANAHRLIHLESRDKDKKLEAARAAIAEYNAIDRALDIKDIRPSRADFFSQYASMIRSYVVALTSADALIRTPDETLSATILDSLYYLVEWDRVRLSAIDAGGRAWGVEPGLSLILEYGVGYLAGHLRSSDPKSPRPDDCDIYASFPQDPLRRAKGVPYDRIDKERAEKACAKLIEFTGDQQIKGEPRALYLLGRVLNDDAAGADPGKQRRVFALLVKAAQDGYPAAFNNLAASFGRVPGENFTAQAMTLTFKQQVLNSSFDLVYSHLRDKAQSPSHKAGLRFLVEEAARVGVPSAHVALVETERGDIERKFRLLLAARLLAERLLADTDRFRMTELRLRAEQIRLDQKEEERVRARVRSWTPEPAVGVPENAVERLLRRYRS